MRVSAKLLPMLAAATLALMACRSRPAPAPPLRFSPRPNHASEIEWRAWDDQLFAAARAEGRPIFLDLSAVWCHFCHVLDETTLSDPEVIALLNRRFLSVRVDADQHPEVERRYLLGGWPTIAFLSPDGEIIDGATFVPSPEFLRMARQTLELLQAGGAALDHALARHRQRQSPPVPASIDAAIVDEIARTLTRRADLLNGGFGLQPKFPEADAVELLLDVGETDLARRALDAMLKLEDPVEGGFFRYAMAADWTHPHYEKMLRGNAELLAAYAHGFRRTGEARYREAALRIVRWMERILLDANNGEVAASQDADEAYYLEPAATRAHLQPPYVDRTFLSDRAARMVFALAAASRDLDQPALHDRAQKLARALVTMRDRDGRLLHARRPGQPGELRGQLADQAEAALALAELGELTEARQILTAAKSLAAPGGGYYDCDGAGQGLARRRERSLEENATIARALVRVGDREAAAATLRSFAGSYALYGVQAAGYGRAVKELLDAEARLPNRR